MLQNLRGIGGVTTESYKLDATLSLWDEFINLGKLFSTFLLVHKNQYKKKVVK